MYMSKVDVLINKIKPNVTAIIEVGIYEKIFVDSLMSGVQSAWLERTVNKTLVATRDETLIQEAYKPLTLTHLYIAFCFIITEYILSVFVIVEEILASRIRFPIPVHLVGK
jgi:hypothetical protein